MGAHIAALVRAPMLTMLLALLILSLRVMTSFGAPESENLLKFKDSLANAAAISNWNSSRSPCTDEKENWIGVLCFNGSVWGLQLENMGLTGDINVDSLVSLPYLRTLSFMNNSFNGSMPDIKKLGALKSVFLSNNHFSGKIPDDAFAGMGYLKKVYLANNQFSGKIPSSLATLPRLLELRLDGNQFEGQIPDFQQKGLKVVNVSNNGLEGPIPVSLSNMVLTSFSGNKNLCGQPLDSCNSSKKSFSLRIILAILALGLMLAAIAVVFILFYRRKTQTAQLGRVNKSMNHQNKLTASYGSKVERGSLENNENAKKAEHGKLSFVRDDIERFDMPDLLRASAEVLGSGTFGSSYKAVLSRGQAVVVKRYKQMNDVGREEFQEHMRRLGRLSHPNLLPLVAYYYRREEKLLVSEYMENGCLAIHLHGSHTAEEPSLDWPTRLKIIKGVTKGLAYLYNELPSLIAPHGHLKSSNVLLDKSFEPLLTDYALLPVINIDHAHRHMVAYKSPEYAQHGRTMKKTDIWSLGILILETLTGRFPVNYLRQDNASETDLANWVSSMVREEKINEVFDKEIGRMRNGEVEMQKLLKIGLACCDEDVETRWDLNKVVGEIESLKERDND